MSLGSKRTWRDLLEILTGTRAFNASALLDYFKPLEEWLIRENTKRNIQAGWESPLSTFLGRIDTELKFIKSFWFYFQNVSQYWTNSGKEIWIFDVVSDWLVWDIYYGIR